MADRHCRRTNIRMNDDIAYWSLRPMLSTGNDVVHRLFKRAGLRRVRLKVYILL
jgi:hypothetical protein